MPTPSYDSGHLLFAPASRRCSRRQQGRRHSDCCRRKRSRTPGGLIPLGRLSPNKSQQSALSSARFLTGSFTCRPLVEKVYSHISPGCTVESAIEHAETDQRSRSHDLFYKDYIREKNDGVILPRRRKQAVAKSLATYKGGARWRPSICLVRFIHILHSYLQCLCLSRSHACSSPISV